MAVSDRGFASMDKEKARAIASKGGKTAHALKLAHEFTSEEARLAGQRGGRVTSSNRDHMAAIGRKGGAVTGARAKARAAAGAAPVVPQPEIP